MASGAISVNSCEVALHETHDSAAIGALGGSSRDDKYQLQHQALPMSAQKDLFVDSVIKEETCIDYGAALTTRFELICRFCLHEDECLLNIFGSNDCIVEMTEEIVDVKIKADDLLPKKICTSCYELLKQCLAFKQQVASTDTALRQSIDQHKKDEIQNQQGSKHASDPRIRNEHNNVDAISTSKELSDGHKIEYLFEDEDYTPDNVMHADSDETLTGGMEDKVDYSPEDKSEPVMNSSDEESARYMQHKKKTSVQCNSQSERCLQTPDAANLNYQCSVCRESFSWQTEVDHHIALHQSPNENAEEQTNMFKRTKCNASFAVDHDLQIHGSVHPEDGKVQGHQRGEDFADPTKVRHNVEMQNEVNLSKSDTEGKQFVCSKCDECFIDLKSLKRHILAVHGCTHRDELLYKCSHCSKSFRGCKELANHVCGHTSENLWKCPHCHKKYQTAAKLALHVRTHMGEKPFKCSQCLKSFVRPSELSIHVRRHTGEKPYKCPHCSKTFRYKPALTYHARTHTGEKPFECSYCSKSFRGSSTLDIHVRTHTGEKPHPCPHCSKTLRTTSALISHVRKHTGEKPFKCTYCSKCFSRSSGLTVHVRKHTGEKPYPCSHCSKTFRAKAALTYHVRTHKSEKPFTCSYCSKSFARSIQRDIHVRTHTGEKQYPCPHCCKIFKFASLQTIHVKTHTGEKPYKCTYCSKCFSRSSGLTVHVRTHTGEKPYPCSQCSKTFRAKAALTYHVGTHTSERPFKCSYCSKLFVTSTSLAVHVRTHTGHRNVPNVPKLLRPLQC